ncbi:MAG: hypothetical protein QM538_06365 [Methylacidiphilales bacterium]|nr:hypothetical protein [Candidatus Methylacidiphilales bacterium]
MEHQVKITKEKLELYAKSIYRSSDTKLSDTANPTTESCANNNKSNSTESDSKKLFDAMPEGMGFIELLKNLPPAK